MKNRSPQAVPGRPRRGLSLVEMLVALTIISFLTSIALPSFQRAVDQSRADIAGANLRAIWTAERVYWLDNRTYTSDLSELVSLGLLDPSIATAASFYIYEISAASSSSFSATATRTGSTRWSGHFSIDQSGVISGTVTATGESLIEPGFQ